MAEKKSEEKSASIRRLKHIQQLEEETFTEFQVDKFYHNNKVNLKSIKDKILKFKEPKDRPYLTLEPNHIPKANQKTNLQQLPRGKYLQTPQVKARVPNIKRSFVDEREKYLKSNISSYQKQENLLENPEVSKQLMPKIQSKPHQQSVSISQGKSPITHLDFARKEQTSKLEKIQKLMQPHERVQTSDKRSIRQINQSSTTTHKDKRSTSHNFRIQPISTASQSLKDKSRSRYRKNKAEKSAQGFSDESSHIFSTKGQGLDDIKIVIDSEEKLEETEKLIRDLWSLYEVLTLLMTSVHQFPFEEEKAIEEYITKTCSGSYESLRLMVGNKRVHKAILTAKLLENLSVLYLSIQLCQRKRIKSSHLVNFLGYCTSNIIFCIRLIFTVHEVKTSIQDSAVHKPSESPALNQKHTGSKSLEFSALSLEILETIRKFELESYKQELRSVKEILFRMEHNNSIINIVQSRLCMNSTKDVQSIVTEFLKIVLHENKPFFQYAHYIFEFLAYYVTKHGLYGTLRCIEEAPMPYLNLKQKNTVVIDPYAVLFYQKNKNIYIRAHCSTFIEFLCDSQCNVVLWSDMMPEDIDPVLQLLPQRSNIFKLYKYHCSVGDTCMIKPLNKLGVSLQRILLIDSSSLHYPGFKANGLEMLWKGEKKDYRLRDLQNVLGPLLQKNCPLRKGISTLRPEIIMINKPKKNKRSLLQPQKFNNIDDMFNNSKGMNRPLKEGYQHQQTYGGDQRQGQCQPRDKNPFNDIEEPFELPMMMTRDYFGCES